MLGFIQHLLDRAQEMLDRVQEMLVFAQEMLVFIQQLLRGTGELLDCIQARNRLSQAGRDATLSRYASGFGTTCVVGTTNAAGTLRGPRLSLRCRAEHSANPSQRMQ